MNAISRSCDPFPSHQAAVGVAPKLRGLRAEFVRRLGNRRMTANEVAFGDESIRKRARELCRDGAIRVCGERACGVTGKLASVYEVVEATK